MPDPEDQLDYQQRQEIDRIADAFERAFRQGERPAIEAYLEKQLERFRSHLLQELLTLELELRVAAQELPSKEQYIQRFPEHRDVIEKAFSAVDVFRTTKPDLSHDVEAEESIPAQLGRYVVERPLGRGGFGVVYLAHDSVLGRLVALKVPRRERFTTEQQVTSFIKEASTAAQLKHPMLVAVHDVQEVGGLPYIIQEYIDGENLAAWSVKNQPSFPQIVRILVSVADALGYLHEKGLTHCDLKLANVLMDKDGQPHVADFGLAIHQDVRAQHKGERFGSPAMMAPEQVRGEGHRLDGRTDIWALGVMMYELLVSQRPFTANSLNELFNEIETLDPRPPRQIDRKVPRELERICLKCLSKRRTDRYSTTDDLREELELWLAQESTQETPRSSITTASIRPVPDSDSATKPAAKIIPKGLRSFDAEDADFFLQLLPGPRDRDDLPESIRFWKTKIEETDTDKTFTVGLLYGPSGCGKSSLVKAGLLPLLSDSVLPIYVEATPAHTEVRILKQLRKHLPHLHERLSLPDAFATLRTAGGGRQRKLLVVIDQFEQWLYSHQELKQTHLVDALRQCEGARLQVLLMIRDDFHASVHRLFHELDYPLVERSNYALVDRFDKQHARKVLIAFGQSYGKLPDELSSRDQQFIAQAVDELAEDEKVISVRLSLFADMLKPRPWTVESLRGMGGVSGVGVTFLEQTFSSKSAPPSHWAHEPAIRQVLKTLLPDAGTDIKGGMRSVVELLEASGYQSDSRRFDEVMRILDSELRIVTPTEPDGAERSEKREERRGGSNFELRTSNFFQLTHDYLVPSLRDWLTRKQRETRKGRAEIKLNERTSGWKSKRESKQLPTIAEWLSIYWWTNSKRWTQPQLAMMRAAGKLHGITWGVGLMTLLAIGVGIQSWVSAERWKNLREQTRVSTDSLQNNLGPSIPVNIGELRKLPRALALAELTKRFETTSNPRHKLALAFALSEFGRVETEFLVTRIDDLADTDTRNLVTALSFDREKALAALKATAARCIEKNTWERKVKLSIAALMLGDVEMADDTCALENRSDPEQRTLFIELFPRWECDLDKVLKTVQGTDSPALRSGVCLAVGSLSVELVSDENKESWRKVVSHWFVEKPDSSTHSAARWLLRQWNLSIPEISNAHTITPERDWFVNSVGSTMVRIKPQPAEVKLVDPIEHFRKSLDRYASATESELENPELLELRAVAYFQTGHTEEALKDLNRLQSIAMVERQPAILHYRTLAMAKLGKADEARKSLNEYFRVDVPMSYKLYVEILVAAWLGESDIAESQLQKGLSDFHDDVDGMYDMAGAAALCSQATAARSSATSKKFVGVALRALDRLEKLRYQDWDYLIQDPDFSALYGDPQFVGKIQDWNSLDEYWVASCEVTRGQFEQFVKDDTVAVAEKPERGERLSAEISSTDEHPAEDVSWYDAVMYCNWLSLKEGRIPCYKRTGANGKSKWEVIAEATGYRLLAEKEWEYACRAGTSSKFSSGDDETVLAKYCQMYPSKGTSMTGSKLPNGWGLHDMHGNVVEWCSDVVGSLRVRRGGGWLNEAAYCQSSIGSPNVPTLRGYDIGFRLALSPSLKGEE